MLKRLAARSLFLLAFAGLLLATATACKKNPTESNYCEESGNC
ncbi:MAG: hypothetical protein AB7L66_07870 [Gemmatimonadales bacterium]